MLRATIHATSGRRSYPRCFVSSGTRKHRVGRQSRTPRTSKTPSRRGRKPRHQDVVRDFRVEWIIRPLDNDVKQFPESSGFKSWKPTTLNLSYYLVVSRESSSPCRLRLRASSRQTPPGFIDFSSSAPAAKIKGPSSKARCPFRRSESWRDALNARRRRVVRTGGGDRDGGREPAAVIGAGGIAEFESRRGLVDRDRGGRGRVG
jgi:hypothetical protein